MEARLAAAAGHRFSIKLCHIGVHEFSETTTNRNCICQQMLFEFGQSLISQRSCCVLELTSKRSARRSGPVARESVGPEHRNLFHMYIVAKPRKRGGVFAELLCVIAVACLLDAIPVRAQPSISTAPVHSVDGSFVRDWLVLGPFPSKDIEADFLADAGGEANVRPKEGDFVTRSDGTALTWTRFRSQRDLINLEQVFDIQPHSVAYAYCELSIDQATETDVRGDCGESAALWLNGTKVGQVPVRPWPYGVNSPPPVLPVGLNSGRNSCLLKMRHGQEEWSFTFQPLPPERANLDVHIADLEGGTVTGASVQFYSEGKPVERGTTGESGSTSACIFPTAGVYDLHVKTQGMNAWVQGVELPPGERRNLDVVLDITVSITGRVLAMDGSPQHAIVVQAIRVQDSRPVSGGATLRGALTSSGPPDESRLQRVSPHQENEIHSLLPMPPFSATDHTDTDGVYRFVNLLPGKYRLRCHGLHVLYYPDGGEDPDAVEPIDVEAGRTKEGIDFVVPEIKKGIWTPLPFATGVPLNHHSIYRTPDGMLWIGTSDYTLQAFDGIEFQTFALTDEPNDTVHAMDYSADGTLWVASAHGISRVVDGQRESVPFDDSLPRQRIEDVLVDPDGTVWFATTSGLCKYDGRDLHKFTVKDGLPSNEVLSLLRSRDGTFWIGTNSGLVRYDGMAFVEPESFPYKGRVDKLLEARDGAIWFAAEGAYRGAYRAEGAYRFDGTTLFHFGAKEGLLNDGVLNIAETSDGNLWFSTWGGINRFNGTTVVFYNAQEGLKGPHMYDIFVDSDDVLWFAGEGGLNRFDPNGFVAFAQRDGLIKPDGGTAGVVALERDSDEHFWIGTEWTGVWRSDGRELESLDFDSHVPELHRTADGTLWMATRHGVEKFDNGEIVRVLAQDWVNALTSDAQGNLWYGDGWEGGGLSRLNLITREHLTFTVEDGLPDNNVYAIEPDADGGLWVGTDRGLARYRDGRVEDLREKLGITTGAVWEIRRDSANAIWISSSLGLHILEPISNDGRAALPRRPDIGAAQQHSPTGQRGDASLAGFQRISITATNGLPTQDIRCSVQSRDGIIWMGTLDRGLLGYDGKAVTSIDPGDSPIGERVFALMINQDDSLWVGSTDAGLTHYRPAKTPPSVRLLNVQMDDVVSSDFSNLPSPEIRTRVAVEYREIDLKTHPEKRQFWYEVNDPSGEILYAGVTKDRRFEWTPREGGDYTFKVQAIDRDLNYSEPVRFTFHATVPWYLNAWITVPGGGTFAGLFLWAFFARAIYIRERRESERLRERMLVQERQAREALEQSNESLAEAKEAADVANRAKSTFLANMSHEIRTPLNAVLGYAQILRQDESLGEDQRQSVGTIERSGSHLLRLINEILDLSKIEAGAMELSESDFDLRELAENLSAMFEPRCREEGLEWRVEWGDSGISDQKLVVSGQLAVADEKGSEVGDRRSDTDRRSENLKSRIADPKSKISVRGDEVKLRQVLINILGNAVKFTDEGRVTLRVKKYVVPPSGGRKCTHLPHSAATGEMLEGTDFAPAEAETTCFTFEVQDTGPGIPDAVRERIFEPFTQETEGRRKGGTGLGLTIARRQIELMGGDLQLESQPGKGSRFFFSLPLASASAQLVGAQEATGSRIRRLQAGTRVRALVADDVKENREILQRLLLDLGVEVTVVQDGEQALRELHSGAFDIAFTDIRMPKLTGFEVARKVLAESKAGRAKLVAVSASVLSHEQRLYREAGFDHFIPKPFRFEQVCECLKRLLDVDFEYDSPSPALDLDPALDLTQPDSEEIKIKIKIKSKSKSESETATATADSIPADFEPGLAERYPLLILVADDYDENQKLAARLLKGFGHDCECAADGREVIRALQRQPFDLVLLDVHMPEMDGFETAEQIRERWSDRERPWLVAATASVTLDDREECLESGMDDFIAKPIEIAEIRRVLEGAGTWKELKNRDQPAGESPIDWARLNRMFCEESDDLRAFLASYIEKTSSQIDKIRAALNAGDVFEVEVLSHRCRGASANFGIRAMVDPMTQLEEAAKAKDLSDAPRFLREAETAFDVITKIIEERDKA